MQRRQTLPITITLPPNLLAVADKFAKREGRTRSEFFREAIRAFIWKKRWEAVQVYGSVKARRKHIKEKDIESIIDGLRSY